MLTAAVQGQTPALTEDVRIVSDVGADAGERAEAARRLLLAEHEEARAEVVRLLEPAGSLTEAQRLLLAETARLSWAPGRLTRPLGALLETVRGEDRLFVIAAIGSIRTPEAARLLIQAAERAPDAAAADAAFAALTRMTGRSDLGQDLDAWKDWFGRVAFLDEPAWQRTLAESLAARADRLARSGEQALDRLVREKHDRFRSIPLEDGAARSAYVASLLTDEAAPVRRLGVLLAKDELANLRTPGPAVGGAAIAMLSDTSPRNRRMGAELLYVLGKTAPVEAGSRLSEALIRESDPFVAAALLQAITHRPEPRIVSVVLRWLENGPVARPAALEAIAALDEKGMLTDPAHTRRAMQAVRGANLAEMGAAASAGVRLLSRRGDASDLDWVALLLTHEDIRIRGAAAEGLAGRPEGLEPLLTAAAEDPDLFAAAASALMQHQCNEEGFRRLLALPAPSRDVRLERVQAMSVLLPAEVAFAVGSEQPDPVMCEIILARLETAAWLWTDYESSPAAPRSPTWLRGLVELAEVRLALGRPAEALESLEPLNVLAIESALTAPVRVLALIWLNRVDEAAAYAVPPEVWVEAMERIQSLPHAPAVLARFDGLFADAVLDEELIKRLDLVRKQIAGGAEQTPLSEAEAAAPDPGPQ